MAAICPSCRRPEMIAYLENADGIHTFPCLECQAVVPRHSNTSFTAITPGGEITDTYTYQAGRLTRIHRAPSPYRP